MELDMRQVINAILYLLRTGCQWANLPQDFPNHNSVFYHYNKWLQDGTRRRVNRLWGPKSRSAADSSLKQLVDSHGADPQGPDIQRSVMATPYLHSACLPVDQEYVDQSLDEVAHD